jgi:hypothetical protein
MAHPEAVLITGAYGSGKSSVAMEMVHLLEGTQPDFAFVDVDFLSWCSVDDGGHFGRLMRRNLADVMSNYLNEGVRRFVLAYAVSSADELSVLRAAIGVDLRVVRLEAPLAEIRSRLAADVTSGRVDDLAESGRWITEGRGVGIEDLSVDNSGPINAAVTTILRWPGWSSATASG